MATNQRIASTVKTQPIKSKRLPERTCVGCRISRPKRELIRVVRSANGTVEIDATGKKAGRGAYICRYGQCWETGLGRRSVDHALKVTISAENRQALATFAEQLPRTAPETHETPSAATTATTALGG